MKYKSMAMQLNIDFKIASNIWIKKFFQKFELKYI